jgi:hypothetical protein
MAKVVTNMATENTENARLLSKAVKMVSLSLPGSAAECSYPVPSTAQAFRNPHFRDM